jgi:hypothetical protein
MNTLDSESLSESNTRFIYKTHRSESFLTFLYFSKKNISNLQILIKYLVHRETNVLIDDQNPRELLIIMRSIFELYSRHPPYFDESKGSQYNISIVNKSVEEVNRLNQIVLNEVVPKIVSMLLQYFGYLKDVQGRRFMDAPKNDSIAGQRELRSVTSVLTGEP